MTMMSSSRGVLGAWSAQSIEPLGLSVSMGFEAGGSVSQADKSIDVEIDFP